MKTVPRNVQVVAQDELPGLGDLPEALSVALADIAGVAREGLLALSVATGMLRFIRKRQVRSGACGSA